MKRGRQWTGGVLAAFVCSVLLSGCLGIPTALQIEVEIYDDTLNMIKPSDGALPDGGEVVLTVLNYTSDERQLMLVRTTEPSPQDLPATILDAVSVRDDDAIVAMTTIMEPGEVTSALGVPQQRPTVEVLHFHLARGEQFLLFDRLGGYRNGIWLHLEPPVAGGGVRS